MSRAVPSGDRAPARDRVAPPALLPVLPPVLPFVLPLVLALLVAGAAPVRAETARADDEPHAVDLLTRAVRAASTVAYHGVQDVDSVAHGHETHRSVWVRNLPGHGTYVDVESGATDTPVVLTPAPDDASVERQLRVLTTNYRVRSAGVARVADRLADVVEVTLGAAPRARYWIDRSTRVLLRREVVDGAGLVVRRTAFRTIAFGAAGVPQRMPSPITASGLGERIPVAAAGRLRADGWAVPPVLGHVLALYDVRVSGTGPARTLHLSYTDGISTVSVFEQRGHLDESHLSGWHHERVGGRTVYVRDTVPQQLTWGAPGMVLTVVADAPDGLVEAALPALPQVDGTGFWARLARGLKRIVSWCNPF